jgi:hypothetical protein
MGKSSWEGVVHENSGRSASGGFAADRAWAGGLERKR